MIKIVCPGCKEEKAKYEIVNTSGGQRRYDIRCPDCGRTFAVYGQDKEGRPPPLSVHGDNPQSLGPGPYRNRYRD